MAAAGNELETVPLRYLIGADGPWDGRDGELIMAPYGTAVAPRRGYSAKYVNLYREDGEPQGYGPYLPRTATAREYDEGVPDPNGDGFWRNLEEQLALANYFVSLGDGRAWATRTAKAITAAGYANMSVTHSGRGEYASSTDILLPMPGKLDRAGGAAPPVASSRWP